MKMMSSIAAATALMIAGSAMADDGPDTMIVDLTGLTSNGFLGDPSNVILDVAGFNAGDVIHSVKWDVQLTTFGASWAEESQALITDSGNTVLNLQWFPGEATSGTFAAGGTDSASDYVMTSSSLNIELYEDGFDDIAGGADAIYDSGSLRINYTAIPGPGALALLGMAGLAGRRRRRA